MIIFYSLYHLNFHSNPKIKREGALLKIISPSGQAGYADCHPWPELGDQSLNDQLQYLSQGHLTTLTECALEFAGLDAQAREKKQSLLSSLSLPSSHFLIMDLLACSLLDIEKIIRQGYTHVKLKMGSNLQKEVKQLNDLFNHASLKLRLDFNNKLNEKEFDDFLENIRHLKKSVDFIEDPFFFHDEKWTAIQNEGWTLAADRQSDLMKIPMEAAGVLVIKPALQSSKEWQKKTDQKCMVTSYLGHPLGQLAAAYVAAKLDPSCQLIHGLSSHLVYQPNLFSAQLNSENPGFKYPPGRGFGFDQELQQLEWQRLC